MVSVEGARAEFSIVSLEKQAAASGSGCVGAVECLEGSIYLILRSAESDYGMVHRAMRV